MNQTTESGKQTTLALYSAALIVFAILFLSAINLHKGVDLADEGFLWYGSQRILHGELPMRDYISYDVGKYLWNAGFMVLFQNDGIITVRIASLVFLDLGILLSYFLVRDLPSGLNWKTSAFLAITIFFLITSIRTHIVDNTVALLMVASLARLLCAYKPKNFLLYGIMVGISATVGRHHGFYGFVGFVLALALLYSAKSPIKFPEAPLAWVLGCLIGYTPVEVLFLFAPNFGQSFMDLLFFTISHQNIPLPIPHPWDAFAKPSHPLYTYHFFVLAVFLLPYRFLICSVLHLFFTTLSERS